MQTRIQNFLFVGTIVSVLTLMSSLGLAAGGEKKPHMKLFPKPEANQALATRPGKVTLLEPAALTKVNAAQVTLKWQAVEIADSYRIQIAKDANFKWLVRTEDFHKETSLEVTNLEPKTRYYWRVYAWKTDNDPSWMSSFADFSSFETN